MDVDAVGPAGRGLEARVVDGVEEVLESARHVTEVGRGPQQVAVRLEHVDGGGAERRAHLDVDPLDLGIGRPRPRRLEQGVERRRRGVVDDQ
jgi:hypothetical protein